jgi:uncharacterized protein YjbI with pentapeptide repeats
MLRKRQLPPRWPSSTRGNIRPPCCSSHLGDDGPRGSTPPWLHTLRHRLGWIVGGLGAASGLLLNYMAVRESHAGLELAHDQYSATQHAILIGTLYDENECARPSAGNLNQNATAPSLSTPPPTATALAGSRAWYTEPGSWFRQPSKSTPCGLKASLRARTDAIRTLYVLGERDFSEAKIAGANLTSTTLTSSYFRSADLSYTNLSRCNLNLSILDGADLSGSNLDTANLENVSCEGCNFSSSFLGYVRFKGSTLNYANFAASRMTYPDSAWHKLGFVSRPNQTTTVLADASLIQADFTGADLRDVDFSGSLLSRATFVTANLNGANFQGAFLGAAVFTGANLKGSNLSQTVLASVDFANADLTETTLTGACRTEETILPPNIRLEPCTQSQLSESNWLPCYRTSSKHCIGHMFH